MIKNIKILFIDLDGTALDVKVNGRKSISDKNQNAIIKARKQNMEIVISSGRIGKRFNRIAKIIGGNYFIQGNGALITNKNNQIIFEKKMTKSQVIQILNLVKQYKLFLFIPLNNHIYGISNFIIKFIVKYIIRKKDFKITSNYKLNLNVDYHKISILGFLFKNKINKFVATINQNFDDLIAVTSAKGYCIEISVKEATKGYAANFIINKLGYMKKQSAHIGDSMNDITTKSFVDKLIAMKNADKDLKLIANYIAPHYKKGGLAKFLQGKYKINKIFNK